MPVIPRAVVGIGMRGSAPSAQAIRGVAGPAGSMAGTGTPGTSRIASPGPRRMGSLLLARVTSAAPSNTAMRPGRLPSGAAGSIRMRPSMAVATLASGVAMSTVPPKVSRPFRRRKSPPCARVARSPCSSSASICSAVPPSSARAAEAASSAARAPGSTQIALPPTMAVLRLAGRQSSLPGRRRLTPPLTRATRPTTAGGSSACMRSASASTSAWTVPALPWGRARPRRPGAGAVELAAGEARRGIRVGLAAFLRRHVAEGLRRHAGLARPGLRRIGTLREFLRLGRGRRQHQGCQGNGAEAATGDGGAWAFLFVGERREAFSDPAHARRPAWRNGGAGVAHGASHRPDGRSTRS